MSRGRWITLALLFGATWLYIPIQHLGRGGVALRTPLDALIPVWPVWVAPYLLVPILWHAGLIWSAWKMPDDLYPAFVAGMLGAMFGSELIFLLYPTYVARPAVIGSDWASALLRYLYSVDAEYNAFPSGHIYISTVFAVYWSRWYPRTARLWPVALGLVVLSTLFTHQHYLLDLVGGLAAGLLASYLGWAWMSARRRISAPASP